jgi:hypothetical protein
VSDPTSWTYSTAKGEALRRDLLFEGYAYVHNEDVDEVLRTIPATFAVGRENGSPFTRVEMRP